MYNMNVLTKEDIKQLKEATRIAIGYRTIGVFARECKLLETHIIDNILAEKLYEFPPCKILRKIANASEGRITYEYLMYICHYEHERDNLDFKSFIPQRGEVYRIDFGYGMDSEQRGVRPVVVLSNNIGNKNSSIVIVAPITSKTKNFSKTHIDIGEESGLPYESTVLIEQSRCISKRRFFFDEVPIRYGMIPEHVMINIDEAIKLEFGLIDTIYNEEYAFELAAYIYNLHSNLKIRKTDSLINLKNKIIEEFIQYCRRFNKDHKIVLNEYKRLNTPHLALVCGN